MSDLQAERTLREANRLSWNAATRAHNSHKGDQARFFREGGSTLRLEELALLGEVAGLRVVHLLCNSGRDTLSIARLGAAVTGVDISDEAIAFAIRLAAEADIAATFVRGDVYDWLAEAGERQERFDIVFSSYGVVHWISDLERWAAGIAAILTPGGAFALVDFHPAERMFSRDWRHIGDYFPAERVDSLDEGVIDYITRSPGRLSPFVYEAGVEDFQNPHPSHLFRYTLGEIVNGDWRRGAAHRGSGGVSTYHRHALRPHARDRWLPRPPAGGRAQCSTALRAAGAQGLIGLIGLIRTDTLSLQRS